MNYSLGIDVGGTHTDVVLLNSQQEIVAFTKQPITADVMQGIGHAVEVILAQSSINPAQIDRAMLGTTHCTNAIVERKNLEPVAHFRLGAPATLAVLPLVNIPANFREKLSVHLFTVSGGYHYDGQLLAALDEEMIRRQLYSVKGLVSAVSVCGVFSPVINTQERLVAEIAQEILGPDIAISLSSEIGCIGLLERENAAILNAALCGVAQSLTNGFKETLLQHNISAPLYFGQNDGTLMPVKQARRLPILTIASGSTNSICGAAMLTDLEDALVVDIGGTTTDVGVLKNGFPRQSSLAAEIGGVPTSFRMPDITSIGLGGGSLVTFDSDGTIHVGPKSVGYQLTQHSLVFGGDTLTVTDIAVANGWANIGDPGKLAHLCFKQVQRAASHYVEMVERTLERMNTSLSDMPVILVGGGACLLPIELRGASKVIRPAHASVANATGVAIAKVSGSVDTIVSTGTETLEACLLQAEKQARKAAVEAGAIPDTVRIIELESLPLGYMPGNTVRIRAKAAGTLSTCLSPDQD